MSARYQLSMEIVVDDFDALKKKAATRAKKEGIQNWTDLRATNLSAVAADLHMLLDPGSISDAGLQIESSEVAFIDGDEPDESP